MSLDPGSEQALNDFIGRMQRLMSERDELSGDISVLRKEIKSSGLCPKAVAKVARLRIADEEASRREGDYISDLVLYARVSGTKLSVDGA